MRSVLLAAVLLQAVPSPTPPSGGVSPTLFAGTGQGLWRTGDWGRNWKQVGGGGPADLPQTLGAVHAVLPIGPSVYVGGEGGLFVSDDWGQTWKRLPLEAPVLSLVRTRYAPTDPTLLVGTTGGLLRSPDGGRTFAATTLVGTPVYELIWPGPDLIAATGRGVLVSTDGGGLFAPSGRGLPPGVVRALVTSSYYPLDPVLFAGMEKQGVFRSPDGGRSWTPTTLVDKSIFDLVWLDAELYAAGEGGVYRTRDAGAPWTVPAKELAGLEVYRLLFPLGARAGPEAFAATSEGAFRTPDAGGRWLLVGLGGQTVHTIETFPPLEPSPFPRPRPR